MNPFNKFEKFVVAILLTGKDGWVPGRAALPGSAVCRTASWAMDGMHVPIQVIMYQATSLGIIQNGQHEQLFIGDWVIMTDDNKPEKPVATCLHQACADSEVLLTNVCKSDIASFKSSDPDHMARDCMKGPPLGTFKQVWRTEQVECQSWMTSWMHSLLTQWCACQS